MALKKTSDRICSVCREKKSKNELYRIVKQKEEKIFLDHSGKADGRGAYICKNQT